LQPHREGSILAGVTEHETDWTMLDSDDPDLDEGDPDDENPPLPDQSDRQWETGIGDEDDVDVD